MKVPGSAPLKRFSPLLTLVSLVLVIVASAAGAASSEPGTSIRNRADISWFDTASGLVAHTRSNAATVTIAGVYRFALDDGLDTTAHAGKFVSLPGRIYNNGNAEDRYRVSATDLSGDSGELQNMRVHHDTNGNGIADPGEPLLTDTTTLPPGGVFQLVIVGSVPTDSRQGETFRIELHVEPLSGEGSPKKSINTITVTDGAFVTLNKSSNIACTADLHPGEVIDYRIDFTNSGNRLAEGRVLDIEGIKTRGILIVDRIPGGTTFIDKQSLSHTPLQAVPLIQRPGDGDRWTRLENWNGVDSVLYLALYIPIDNLSPGQSGHVAFSLKARDNNLTGRLIENVAWIDIDGDGVNEFESNSVCNRVTTDPVDLGAASPATLRFIQPASHLRRAGEAPDFNSDQDFVESGSYRLDNDDEGYDPVRDGLYIELSAADIDPTAFINNDGEGAYVVVTLRSTGTGDSLQVIMVETAPNSGIYRTIRPITLSAARSGDGRYCPGGSELPIAPAVDLESIEPSCVLQSIENDTLQVLYDDSGIGISLTQTVIVDPFGTVFDAYTLAPIADATVAIIEMSGNSVRAGDRIAEDLVTGTPLTMLTDADGRYRVPQLPSGTRHYVRVEPPATHLFPSDVPPEQFTSYGVTRHSYGSGSQVAGIGGIFTVPEGEATPLYDIPLDPTNRGMRLVVEKRALQSEAEPGDVIAYSLRVRNQSEEEQYNVVVFDRLPYGFKLVPNTMNLNGEEFTQFDGAPGPDLEFPIGTLEPGIEHELTYALEATAGSIDSDGINVAQATGRTHSGVQLFSAESRARVRIRQTGVLSDRAALFGKVYVDADCNNLQNDAEWPIGGIKLYLDDGTFAVTDENGQYSLYGLEPGLHALRVDPLSLPSGLLLKPLDNANAANGESRFVELSAGDFHRADFAASCPQTDIEKVFDQLMARNEIMDGDWLLGAAERFNQSEEYNVSNESARDADIDGDLSNGILNGPDAGRTRSNRPLENSSSPEAGSRQANDPVSPAATDDMMDPELAAETITTEQARTGTWLWPRGDSSLDGRFVAVVRAGVVPMLFVNGKPVDESQIGERIENRSASAQIVAWYGVTLRSGLNRLEVRGTDSFGNTRILARKQFKRPTMGTRMVLRARQDTLPADGGRTLLPIDINILDDNDYPAQGIHFVTLSANGSRQNNWLEEDIQDNEPGHQIRVVNGRGVAHLRSSEFTGTVIVRAQANDMAAEMRVYQVAALRPLFGIGLLELGVNSGSITGHGFTPTDQADGLDDEDSVDASLSMFLKGRVKGNAQLTLAYDSDKDEETDLLRDINPNAHYPIHGDASIRGYEAQSRSRLYARLERGKNSVMWGDYLTDANSDVGDLARVQRVMTGFNSQYHNGNTRIQLFAARPEDTRSSEEIRGNGTAMLFRLRAAPIVPNSEVVELIVRDRENPGLVLSAQRLTRFGDYVLDSISGQLTFDRPIPSFDEELNPVYARVSYDLESGGESHTVAGVRVQHALSDSLLAGISHTDDRNPDDSSVLSGAYIDYRPDENTDISVGLARMTHSDERGPGTAKRISVERTWGSRQFERRTSVTLAHADENFTNPGAGIAAGRQELRIDHRQQLSDSLRADMEGTHSQSLSNRELRSAIGITLRKSMGDWTLRGGTRHIRQRTSSSSERFNTAISGVERRFHLGNRAGSASLEYEQDIGRMSRNRLGFSGKLQVHDHAHLYARYERQNGIYDFTTSGGTRNTESFAIGGESDIIPSTRLYSEYRLRGGIDSRDLETGSGVRGNYEITPGVTISPSIEVVDTLSGDNSSDGVAVSLGATDLRNRNAKLTGRAEYRKATASDYIGLRLSYAARLDLNWTALLREDFTRQTSDIGQMDLRHAFTASLARRPRLDNRHHMLFQYTWKVERAEDDTRDRDVHVLSTHQNVQIGPRLILSGRLGAKQQNAFLKREDYSTAAGVADIRASWDIDRRWNVDLRTGALITGRRSRRHSFGAALSYLLERNLQLHIGYNFIGFREEDLDPEGYDARGIRLGMRYKFDDKAFRWLQE
ncbi:hypothetical protein ACUNV4_13920 [Granulosicoccus sp. 3-233]|uniref:hypothetical protein n=1 Tax=Granulosicoccus sp. 3-233 TaxID=3417969 RepID=UPI003D32BEBB